jgi:hypothetical protein
MLVFFYYTMHIGGMLHKVIILLWKDSTMKHIFDWLIGTYSITINQV